MDNRLKKLEKFYCLLLENPKTNTSKLIDSLKLTTNKLEKLLGQLQDMGLKIHSNNTVVELKQKLSPINIEVLEGLLKHINKPIHYIFSTDSTNQLAKQDANPAIYITDHQSAGRGRQAKQWLTPLGQSIALSINHEFKCALKDLSGLNIVIGVALIKTAQKLGNSHLSLKWPNDVLGTEGKVAGILIEASGNKKQSKATIGIGINWQIRDSLLDSIDQPCMNIDIAQNDRTDFIASLILEIETQLQEFSTNRLKNIQAIWNKFDAYSNKEITIRQGNQSHQAQYIGIDQSGCLKIQTNGTIKTLASGEVSIRKVD
jgi:BirA family biotin operon repressor/biotin-[acetyl-CoA-carboxylase] ligase